MARMTDPELVVLRDKHVKQYADMDLSPEFQPDVIVFTCDDCSARYECEFVFDLYNTNGDCLAEK